MAMFTLRDRVVLAGSIVAAHGAKRGDTGGGEGQDQPAQFLSEPHGGMDRGGRHPGRSGAQYRRSRRTPNIRSFPMGPAEQPTYRIADLTNPNLTPWAKEIMKKDNDEVIAGKIAFTSNSSCTLAGVPAFLTLGGNNNPYRFIQTAKEVRILRDADLQVRRVYLDVPAFGQSCTVL